MASRSDKMATFQVWDTCIALPSTSGFKKCHIIVKICIVPLSFSRLMMSVFSTALSSIPKTRISLKINANLCLFSVIKTCLDRGGGGPKIIKMCLRII